jgi:hypothetical protein
MPKPIHYWQFFTGLVAGAVLAPFAVLDALLESETLLEIEPLDARVIERSYSLGRPLGLHELYLPPGAVK